MVSTGARHSRAAQAGHYAYLCSSGIPLLHCGRLHCSPHGNRVAADTLLAQPHRSRPSTPVSAGASRRSMRGVPGLSGGTSCSSCRPLGGHRSPTWMHLVQLWQIRRRCAQSPDVRRTSYFHEIEMRGLNCDPAWNPSTKSPGVQVGQPLAARRSFCRMHVGARQLCVLRYQAHESPHMRVGPGRRPASSCASDA